MLIVKKIVKVIIFNYNKVIINKTNTIRKVYNYKIKTFGLYYPSFTERVYTVWPMYNVAYIPYFVRITYVNTPSMEKIQNNIIIGVPDWCLTNTNYKLYICYAYNNIKKA